ncbi:hypothetical protein ACIHCM_04690 [Streptomyces sp. NPDC052023]|uniref:hypothetical protein n=1 Tax=Streptomyces sp. NPDC052023 TaxID=3365681 RepID=UPI0037D6C7FC
MRGAWSAFSTQSPRRRGALLGAAAALVCTGGVLAACGSGGGDAGYVAVGAAGGPPRASGTAGTPPDGVTLVPLDGTGTPDTTGRQGDSRDSPGDSVPAPAGERPPGRTPPPAHDPSATANDGRTAPTSGDSPDPGGTTAGPPSPAPTRPSGPTPAPGRPAPSGPAEVSMGTPVREPADKRWRERVTVTFHNTGASAVRSGTVTFGTHVIGALGVDWGTIESNEELPAPIAAGARRERTWTVCVDAWRVPLGMHVETRDVSIRWE